VSNEQPRSEEMTVSLPYFEEYLAAVLKPRIERILAQGQDTWNEIVWRAVVHAVTADQPGQRGMSPEAIERLLRDALGLKIDAKVTTRFEPPSKPAEPLATRVEPNGGDVVDRRSESNPLVRAIAGPRRVGPGR